MNALHNSIFFSFRCKIPKVFHRYITRLDIRVLKRGYTTHRMHSKQYEDDLMWYIYRCRLMAQY